MIYFMCMQITAWGDSITYGAGDEQALGWVGRLRKAFYEDDCEIYNRGVCGDTTDDLLERFDNEMRSTEPSVLLFAIGINDSKFLEGSNEQKVPFQTFQKNVETLISKAQESKGKIFVIGLTEVKEEDIESSSIFTNQSIQQYNSYLRDITEGKDIWFIDMKGVLNTDTDLVDGLHPNAEGYEKMFQKILSKVEIK